jgi:hypothetical protein
MSVSSQKDQSHDFLVEQAIKEGMRQAAEVEPEQVIAIEFNNEQGHKIIELTSALTLSSEILLESAISYFSYQYKTNPEFAQRWKEYGQPVVKQSDEYQKQAQNFYKPSKLVVKKLTLSAETLYKLKEIDMEEKVQDCVAIGINMLYEKLTNK